MEIKVYRNRKAYQGRGEGGKGVWKWEKREGGGGGRCTSFE